MTKIITGNFASFSFRILQGQLWGSGYNNFGQLGIGGGNQQLSPVQILTPNTSIQDNWVSIAANYEHSLGIKSDGSLWAWGCKRYGQLGNGSSSAGEQITPLRIGTNTDWVRISIGGGNVPADAGHCLALKSNGTLWAWGLNQYGQLGDGSNLDRNSPVQVSTDSWSDIAAGSYHSLGLKSDGTLWSWGNNIKGQLGIGTANSNTNNFNPVQIGTDFIKISAGYLHSLAIKSNGTLWGWGIKLADGNAAELHSPTQIGIDDNWHAIAAGGRHSLGLRANGSLWAWGLNPEGQLGTGLSNNEQSPIRIGNDNNWVSISAGYESSFGVKSNGTIFGWGINSHGQLGDGTIISKNIPTQI